MALSIRDVLLVGHSMGAAEAARYRGEAALDLR